MADRLGRRADVTRSSPTDLADADGVPSADMPTTTTRVHAHRARRRHPHGDAFGLRHPGADGPAREDGHGGGGCARRSARMDGLLAELSFAG
ncbi:hypothetical protein LV779_06255 [Streptomyces thinghirensis]|nr:hypothetical protein [Streptomyces thinghirensis]